MPRHPSSVTLLGGAIDSGQNRHKRQLMRLRLLTAKAVNGASFGKGLARKQFHFGTFRSGGPIFRRFFSSRPLKEG